VEENQQNAMQLMSALQKQIDSFASQVKSLEKSMSVLMSENSNCSNSNGNETLGSVNANDTLPHEYVAAAHEFDCSFAATADFGEQPNATSMLQFVTRSAQQSVNHLHDAESASDETRNVSSNDFMVNP
jgi:SET domain-containing protein